MTYKTLCKMISIAIPASMFVILIVGSIQMFIQDRRAFWGMVIGCCAIALLLILWGIAVYYSH